MRASPLKMNTLLIFIATIGLSSCSDKSKNGNLDASLGPTPAGDVQPLYTHEDPTVHGINAFSIAEDEQQKSVSGSNPHFTGLKTSDGLQFTDSQNDYLIEKARSVLTQVNPKKFKANLDFAQRLHISQVVVHPENPLEIKVSYVFKSPDSGTKYFTSSGVLQDSVGQKSAFLKNTNSSAITVSARCMDSDGTCYNVLIRFLDSSNTLAYGVFRTSPLRVRFYAEHISALMNNSQRPGVAPSGQIGPIITPNDNEDFETITNDGSKSLWNFYRLLSNSTENGSNFSRSQNRRHIKNAVLETASIVNGVSTFSLFFKIHNRNREDSLLPLFGDLVRRSGNKNNFVDKELLNYKSIVLKDYSPDDIDNSLNSMSHVSLLQNNGKGSFQLGISFGADQHQSSRLVLTISRTPVRILDIPNYEL